jgi:hypothetical protein
MWVGQTHTDSGSEIRSWVGSWPAWMGGVIMSLPWIPSSKLEECRGRKEDICQSEESYGLVRAYLRPSGGAGGRTGDGSSTVSNFPNVSGNLRLRAATSTGSSAGIPRVTGKGMGSFGGWLFDA